ncbi:uncharacterized protein LOC134234082 [Saccostrea cucullata]|uniref:uncharacterized protein LOC134234082 n=1 Tax=Saccostrea cuccullata TaxID=36930 RepID=UPI002ED431FF
MHWSLSHYFRFQVVVQNEFDAKFLFSLETTAHSFIFNDAEPTHTYIIKWVPLDKQRSRVTHLREEKNVTIHKDCMITPSSTKKVTISDHDSLSTSTKPTSTSFESEQEDYRIVGTASSTTLLPDSGNELFSTGIAQDGNIFIQKRANVNVKSTCYSNDGANEYDEVGYCLAQYIEV